MDEYIPRLPSRSTIHNSKFCGSPIDIVQRLREVESGGKIYSQTVVFDSRGSIPRVRYRKSGEGGCIMAFTVRDTPARHLVYLEWQPSTGKIIPRYGSSDP